MDVQTEQTKNNAISIFEIYLLIIFIVTPHLRQLMITVIQLILLI